MISSPGMVSQKKYVSHLIIFSSLGGRGGPQTPWLFWGLRPLDRPFSFSLNVSLVGHDTCSLVMLPWKCILLTRLKLKNQGLGSVYYYFGLENARPWQCIQFSDLKTHSHGSVYYFRTSNRQALEVYTIFGPENSRRGCVSIFEAEISRL